MEILLRLLVVAGLAVDAVIHWIYAPDMEGVQGGTIKGDDLFIAQAILAAVVAVLNLVWARGWTYALSFLVAGSAVGALILYYYVPVGPIGPLPDMHEPVWYFEKTASLVGEGIATLAALAGFFVVRAKKAAAGTAAEPATGAPAT
jgi:hypothetical protein